jgi:(p)ppGpp synthase/HD superfamily hydrolase
MLTARFDEALRLAHDLHRAQVRKGKNIPYISHLLAVSALVIEHGGTEDQAIAALLHDGPEDQGGASTLDIIRTRFGNAVADIVADCTDAWAEPKPPWKERKVAYVASLAHKPASSLLVSAADKAHNARAIVEDLRLEGAETFARFNGGRDGTLWYYNALSDAFTGRIPSRLQNLLTAAVEEMEALA